MAIAKNEKSQLGIHLDVGHDSIGWCVTRTFPGNERFLVIPGTGVVLFPADDCLANQRRAFRRQRRHIRATRQRIARMKALVLSLGVLSESELNANPTAAPWKLAAQTLTCGKVLTWQELWCVLRWYAHNRGYDGNALASAKNRSDADADDIKKNEAARKMMADYGTQTMAETMCRFLGVNPEGKRLSSREYFKGNKISFDRSCVVKEVTRILEAHKGRLPGLTGDFIHTLVADPLTERNFLRFQPKLPFHIQSRYWGGILFGQLAPRFDNRIIGHCPISGKKLPCKATTEFLEYRWAMMLANIRVGVTGRNLTVEEIAKFNGLVAAVGGFTGSEFKKAVVNVTDESASNVDALLTAPEADASLVRYPGVYALTKRGLREILEPKAFRKFANMLFKGKRLTLKKIADAVDETTREKIAALTVGSAKGSKRGRKTGEAAWHAEIRADLPSGRAPYARDVLKAAAKTVYDGKEPREKGGILYRDCTKADVLKEQDIDKETNNHLIRHRVKILLRLLKDIVHDYAENNPAQVAQVTIEMARDLKDLSGMTNEDIKKEMSARAKQHMDIAKALSDKYGIEPRNVTPGLIRKVRIAEDMGWKCPYTGEPYDFDAIKYGYMDKDHIIPRSKRTTDSLDSLVLTFKEINEWKGDRTGLQFILDCAGMSMEIPKHVDHPTRKLSIFTKNRYMDFISHLKVFGHPDDRKRQKRRKQNLLQLKSDESGMTEGMLTRTAYITTLAMKAIRGYFAGCGRMPEIVSIPGRVTAMLRNQWNILGILAEVDERVKAEDGRLRLKQEIRGITHMHHAVDAITLGLAATFIPHDGTFWAMLCKRRVTNEEKEILGDLGIFRFSAYNESHLVELPKYLRAEIKDALAEQRVVVHQPQERNGLKVQQNTWGVERVDGDRVYIRKRERDEKTGKIKTERKDIATGKAFGLNPTGGHGKLKALKGVLRSEINYGVALLEEPIVIRHHHVWAQLAALAQRNNGHVPKVLRKGDIIDVQSGRYAGRWCINSIKDTKRDGIRLELIAPYAVKFQNSVSFAKEACLKALLKDKIRAIKQSYTGVPLCPTTSSTSQQTT